MQILLVDRAHRIPGALSRSKAEPTSLRVAELS
jgi:hypothetical protein